jgi:uncharacterized membrane protein YkvA (DUF1232 family)
MAWYWWALIAAVAVVGACILVWRLVRATARGRRFLALSNRGKLGFGRTLLSDPNVGRPAKITLVLLAGYLLMPFDLIPDFIPVLGQLDDAVVVMIAVGVLLWLVDREDFDRALSQAELATAKPVDVIEMNIIL